MSNVVPWKWLTGLRPLFDNRFAPPIVMLGPWVLGVIIAVVIPDDILSRTGWLRDYAEWFANIFPYMSRAAAHSAFPEVTLFFHAVMWTIAPVWLGALLLIKHDKRLYEKQRERRWFLLFAVPIMLGAMILMLKITFTSDELTRVEKIMSYSRFGLGFSGTAAYAGGLVFFTHVLIIWIRGIPALYFNKTTEEQPND